MAEPNWKNRTLWTGRDNVEIMRGMNSDSVDLIYLDPPFNSNQNYAAPIGSKAAGAAFKDSWTFDDVDRIWLALLRDHDAPLHAVIEAARLAHGKGMAAYLGMMAQRLQEMHRLLKPAGSLYLHCDHTAGAYLKLLLDGLFGQENFRNEVIWHYGKMSNTSRNFPCNHDTILRYSKTDSFTFNPLKGAESEYRKRYERHLTENQVLYGTVKHSTDKLVLGRVRKVKRQLGRDLRDSDVLFDFDKEYKIQSDVIYTSIIKGNSKERVGYPTQKPLALLRRLVGASSNPGDVVFDPFCGCATTCVAAEELGRHWVGIDIAHKAAELIRSRLQQAADEHGGVRQRLDDVVHRTDLPQRTDLGKLPRYTEHKDALYGTSGGYCGGCGEHFLKRNLTVDHIVPTSKGGTDHTENLWLLCGACNSSKGTKSQALFLRDRMSLKGAGVPWLEG